MLVGHPITRHGQPFRSDQTSPSQGGRSRLVGHPIAVAEGRGRYREGGDAPRVFGDILHCSRPGRLGAGPCGRRPTRLCTDKLPICTQIGGASLGAAAPPPSRAGLWPSARRQASFPALSPSFQALQALCQASQAPQCGKNTVPLSSPRWAEWSKDRPAAGSPGRPANSARQVFVQFSHFRGPRRAAQGRGPAALCCVGVPRVWLGLSQQRPRPTARPASLRGSSSGLSEIELTLLLRELFSFVTLLSPAPRPARRPASVLSGLTKRINSDESHS